VRIRRGKETYSVFKRAVSAKSVFDSIDERCRPIHTESNISIVSARAMFERTRRVQMHLRGDGVYYFVYGSHAGQERIELEVPDVVR